MVLQTPPAFLQAGTYSALSDRLHLVTAVSQRQSGFASSARGGFYPDRYPTYSNPSGMDWAVGACAGVIANTFTADGGEYRFINPSTSTGTFAASSPTLNRHDILGFQVKDDFYDSSGLNEVVVAVIQGTGSAGAPVDPVLPASFLPVARAVINATVTTPTLQDMRTRTVNSMAILPVADNTERATLGTMPAGFTVWNIAAQRHEVADGAGGWTALPGAADVPVIGGEYRASGAQTFPTWAQNKLNFGTTIQAASGITWNGSNQFTVVTASWYGMTAFVKWVGSGSNSVLLGIGKATITGAGSTGDMWTGWASGGGGESDSQVSGSRWLPVGATICVWAYISGGAPGAPLPSGTNAAMLAEFAVWRDR